MFKRYHFLLSPGTAYSSLRKLEKKGLVEGYSNGKKTVYKLTDMGKLAVEEMLKEPIIKNHIDILKNFCAGKESI